MALTVDYTAIADWEALHADEDEFTKSKALAFYSLPLGFGEVTERNAEEVYAAITVYDGLLGQTLMTQTNDDGSQIMYHLSPHDVKRRIGLRTNAVNGETLVKALTRITKERLREERWAYQREVL